MPVTSTSLFVVILTFSVSTSFGQTATLSGRVIDNVLGDALIGANLSAFSVPPTPVDDEENHIPVAGAATDLRGKFRLVLAPGDWQIRVSYVGYHTQEIRVHLSDGEERSLSIELRQENIRVNPITVTASRRREKLLDAPAAITVLEPRQLETTTALTTATHLATVPGVDLINTGLVSSRVVIRGFNDNLASSLLTLVDNRIAQAPSVRLTALQLIPISNGDIDHIEVVSGPASALYGPNAANGVLHIMTKSPFESTGTMASLARGEQDVFLGSFRHAGTRGPRLGYKLSVQYYSGSDFEYFDPVEIQERQRVLDAGASPDTIRIGARNFDVRNIGLNGRVDFRFRPDLSVILNAGLTQGSNIEITPTGAAQVDGARIGYLQARLLYKDLFAQVYGNLLDSGKSFFLRTGEVFKDKSRLFVAQAQHHYTFGPRLLLTYGSDLYYTVPDGEGTVTGRNENSDQILEWGAYVQSDTRLTRRLSFTGAARLDYHDRLNAWTFSPRAALVFQPRPGHHVRATFNRAFKTPIANDLFSDVLGRFDIFQLGRMEPLVGFAPTTDLRVQGMIRPFRFGRSANGRPLFRSPFAPLAGLTRNDFIELGDPSFTNVMWDVARRATIAGLADQLAGPGLIPQSAVSSVSAALESALPGTVAGVNNVLKTLNLDNQQFVPVDAPVDFDRLKVTQTETWELGYKGLFGRGLVFSVDVYHTRIKNFLGPFQVGTPNVFLESSSLFQELNRQLEETLADPAHAADREALLPLDQIPILGNNDGSAARELATLISTGVASAIPFGTVSPDRAFDPTAVILMRRNFGDLSVSGADIDFTMFLSRQIRIGGMYSWISDNFFENVDGVDDISLNAPRHKAGGSFYFDTADRKIGFQIRGRFVEGFRVDSDVYSGRVESYGVIDGSIHYRLPFSNDTFLNLSIQNLTNNKHREFVFVPEIGRLAILRLTHDF